MGKILICSHCGYTWEEFLNRKHLGCSHCYQTFHHELTFFLTELHGNHKHAHLPSPSPMSKPKSGTLKDLAHLRDLLSLAVQQEKFEEALQLKEQITLLEKKHASG